MVPLKDIVDEIVMTTMDDDDDNVHLVVVECMNDDDDNDVVVIVITWEPEPDIDLSKLPPKPTRPTPRLEPEIPPTRTRPTPEAHRPHRHQPDTHGTMEPKIHPTTIHTPRRDEETEALNVTNVDTST